MQRIDTHAVGDSIEVTAVYIGGWWVLPLGVALLAVAGLGLLWWAWRRRRRRHAA